jgi:hypothetical protein
MLVQQPDLGNCPGAQQHGNSPGIVVLNTLLDTSGLCTLSIQTDSVTKRMSDL